MNKIKAKFKQKAFVQNLIVEVIGDGCMLFLGLLGGYFVKTVFM